ncbi:MULTISPECIES: hypothetical protein [Chryseobacterium]|uniref:Uncharacterized protein n=1 Tax=Chryseobacterium taihuense TaxID=1141221 RepID=A0A4U8WGX3_9FLAO|nr:MULTISPECIES: hypothetical protein [Chryseobacterium]QQV02079.1 hypothetical protein I6I61_13490 [Chryseobacterium sp. FDAARGOS 1104]VFB04690.1 Uncharacterised protein [Chryseobacterium taihuense]
MKFFISFFIIFTIAIRPVLPLINYVINYDYIVENLCESRTVENSYCKGKCYVAKELSKAEKQSLNGQNIKIAGLDVFVSNEIFTLTETPFQPQTSAKLFVSKSSLYNSEYFSRIFHPPLS